VRDSLSSSIADMFFLEQVFEKRRLLLAPMQMAAQGGHHLSSVGRSALAQGVYLDVLVEQLIGIKPRAVAGQDDQAQSFRVGSHKALGKAERCTGCPSTIRYSLPEACLSSRLMNSTKPLASNLP